MEPELGEASETSPRDDGPTRSEISQNDRKSQTVEGSVDDGLLDAAAEIGRVTGQVSRQDIENAVATGEVDRKTLEAGVNAFLGDVKARWKTVIEAYPALKGEGRDAKNPMTLWYGESHSFLEVSGILFRFPMVERTPEETGRELALLPQLNERLHVRVPKVEYDNRQAETEWYEQFIGYRTIPGHRQKRAFLKRNPGSLQMVHALGGILSELHATRLDDATRLGMEQSTPEDVYEFVNERYRMTPRVEGSFKGEAFEKTFEDFFTLALEEDDIYDFRPTVRHGAFSRHVLFDDALHPTGVVGWGNAEIGDPAEDFADVMHFVGPAVIADAFRPYQTRDAIEGLWKRTLVHWGIDQFLAAASAAKRGDEDVPDYVYINLVRDNIPRLWDQTPRAGGRSIIAKVARLKRT